MTFIPMQILLIFVYCGSAETNSSASKNLNSVILLDEWLIISNSV